MNDPMQALQALLQPAGLKNALFPANSRYAGIATATLQVATPAPTVAQSAAAAVPGFAKIKITPDAATTNIVYLRRRFVPSPDVFALLQTHVVVEGERLDNLAAQYLGDPLLFWRMCDANGAMRPEEVTDTPGKSVRITLPQGIPGVGGTGNA